MMEKLQEAKDLAVEMLGISEVQNKCMEKELEKERELRQTMADALVACQKGYAEAVQRAQQLEKDFAALEEKSATDALFMERQAAARAHSETGDQLELAKLKARNRALEKELKKLKRCGGPQDVNWAEIELKRARLECVNWETMCKAATKDRDAALEKVKDLDTRSKAAGVDVVELQRALADARKKVDVLKEELEDAKWWAKNIALRLKEKCQVHESLVKQLKKTELAVQSWKEKAVMWAAKSNEESEALEKAKEERRRVAADLAVANENVGRLSCELGRKDCKLDEQRSDMEEMKKLYDEALELSGKRLKGLQYTARMLLMWLARGDLHLDMQLEMVELLDKYPKPPEAKA